MAKGDTFITRVQWPARHPMIDGAPSVQKPSVFFINITMQLNTKHSLCSSMLWNRETEQFVHVNSIPRHVLNKSPCAGNSALTAKVHLESRDLCHSVRVSSWVLAIEPVPSFTRVIWQRHWCEILCLCLPANYFYHIYCPRWQQSLCNSVWLHSVVAQPFTMGMIQVQRSGADFSHHSKGPL
jgi:hypothetical protein